MIKDNFKEFRKKFQGKYYKRERSNEWTVSYFYIKKIHNNSASRFLIEADMVNLNLGNRSVYSYSDVIRWAANSRSFHCVFGKRISPGEYREMFKCSKHRYLKEFHAKTLN